MATINYSGGTITGSGNTIDGGGKTFASNVVISNASNLIIQNINLSGNARFILQGTIRKVRITNCGLKISGHAVDTASNMWQGPFADVDGLEIDNLKINGGSGYLFHLRKAKNVNLHHIEIYDKVQGGDGAHPAVFYMEETGGVNQIHHCFGQRCYGNFTRIWGAPGSSYKIYNNAVVDNQKYSLVEANGNYYGRDFKVEVYNNIFGNPQAAGYETALVVGYDAANVINVHDNIVYGSTSGVVQKDSSAVIQANNKTTGSGTTLPDGTKWSDGLTTPIPVPVDGKPTADAGKDIVVQLPQDSVVLDGAGKDVEGKVGFSWTKLSGPAVVLSTPVSEDLVLLNLIKGEYEFQLEVTDTAGQKAIDKVKVTVLEAVPPVEEIDVVKVITQVFTSDGKTKTVEVY